MKQLQATTVNRVKGTKQVETDGFLYPDSLELKIHVVREISDLLEGDERDFYLKQLESVGDGESVIQLVPFDEPNEYSDLRWIPATEGVTA